MHARSVHWLNVGLISGRDYAPSLLEKHQDGSEVDFPLPLATTDERERLIYEKDEEVRFIPAQLAYFCRSCRGYLFFFCSLCVVEEDAGSAGKDSGADAAHPTRRLLTPSTKEKGGSRNTFLTRTERQSLLQVHPSKQVKRLQRMAGLNKSGR